MTLKPTAGLAFADSAVLMRTAVKQTCRSLGYHTTFMCRLRLTNKSSGRHLHQSLISRNTSKNASASSRDEDALSPLSASYAAGLLKHAAASCLLTTPTVNGYKGYRHYSLGAGRHPLRARQPRCHAAFVSAANTGAPRIEDRVGEPAASPYLYMASQILSGLDSVENA